MKRNYLPVTVVVIVLGVGLSFIPETVELSQPYELVTVYNQTEKTKQSIDGAAQEFTLRTGRVETKDGFSPTLILTNSAEGEMNTTVVNLDRPDPQKAYVNESLGTVIIDVEEADSYDLEIAGRISATERVEVTAAFIYYRHTPPENYTYYPYRYFGLGMASVGVVATAIAAYLGKSREAT
jgi:hypothetical protein